LIFWYQSPSLCRPFLLATATLYSILIALFATSLVAVLTARVLGIPLKTRNMGGGQGWPDLEKAPRSQEAACLEIAHCGAGEPSSETKLAEATSSMRLYTSPQPTYMPIIAGSLADQTTATIDSGVRGTANDAMEMDSTIQLLFNNGINPDSLTPIQLQTFRAQDANIQLQFIQVYKDNQARSAHLQAPRPMPPARQWSGPEGEFNIKPSNLMFSPATSPYELSSNREAEMAYLATMREWHQHQRRFMTGRMQEQLLAAQALPREGTSIVEQAHGNAVPAVQPVIDSQMPLELHGGIHSLNAPNDDHRPMAIGFPPPEPAHHPLSALNDYQMQLMLLEQQNGKRLLMARQD